MSLAGALSFQVRLWKCFKVLFPTPVESISKGLQLETGSATAAQFCPACCMTGKGGCQRSLSPL